MFDVIIINADIELAYKQLKGTLFGVSVFIATHLSHFIKWLSGWAGYTNFVVIVVYSRNQISISFSQTKIILTFKFVFRSSSPLFSRIIILTIMLCNPRTIPYMEVLD